MVVPIFTIFHLLAENKIKEMCVLSDIVHSRTYYKKKVFPNKKKKFRRLITMNLICKILVGINIFFNFFFFSYVETNV